MENTYQEGVSLTRRELSILQQVALGLTSPKIAATLGLQPKE